jgi:hypothetical protein
VFGDQKKFQRAGRFALWLSGDIPMSVHKNRFRFEGRRHLSNKYPGKTADY